MSSAQFKVEYDIIVFFFITCEDVMFSKQEKHWYFVDIYTIDCLTCRDVSNRLKQNT